MKDYLIPEKLNEDTYEVKLKVQMKTIKSFGQYLDEIYIPELGKRIRVIVSLADTIQKQEPHHNLKNLRQLSG